MSSSGSPGGAGEVGAPLPDHPDGPFVSDEGGGPMPPVVWDELPGEVRRAAERALELKAEEVTVLDVRGLSSATDFFVIASGRSDVQVRAIAEHVIDGAKSEGTRPEHVEGREQGRWVLIDYIDHVVHVFQPAVREFYQLETLWGDAASLVIDEA